jgi:hypothetical protein
VADVVDRGRQRAGEAALSDIFCELDTCGRDWRGFFMIILDTSIVNLALARIGTELHSGLATGALRFCLPSAPCPFRFSPLRCSRQTRALRGSGGRIGAAIIVPGFLFIQTTWGVLAVFGTIAVMLAVAAVAVTPIGSETRGLALDAIAPPTG